MRYILAGLSLALALGVMVNPSKADTAKEAVTKAGIDPLQLYGPEMHFRIYRNDAPVGDHRVTFNQEGDKLVVQAQSTIDVKLFFFNAYSFRYQSKSAWQDGALVNLHAQTNDDGDVQNVTASSEGGILKISDGDTTLTTPVGIFPTNHWNSGVVATSQVLNTITGEINIVSITQAARETVPFGMGTRNAWRYDYGGELETQVFYDDGGRWLGMRFEAQDGSTVEYRCVKCAPPPIMAETEPAQTKSN